MATDPTLPPDPAVILPDAAATEASRSALEGASGILPTLIERLGLTKAQGIELSKAFHLSGAGASVFTSAMLGANKAMEQFSRGTDSDRLLTFTGQVDSLTEMLSRQGTGVDKLRQGFNALAGIFTKSGGSVSTVQEILRGFGGATIGAVKALADLVKAAAQNADQQIVLQNATIQQMAAQGNLNVLYAKSKDSLQELNAVAAKQTEVLGRVSKATGLDTAIIAGWQSQLNTIPGYQKSVIESTGRSSEAQKLFTRTVEFAIGSGRKYESVIDDMRSAIMNYGTSQEDALKFTARMSESAELLGIPVDALRTALNNSSDAFRMFATEGDAAAGALDGIQESMTEYIKMLRDSGIPMRNAIELAGNLSSSIAGLSTAQKAYLSGTTGGPGGLMGAAKINQLLIQGKTEEVFKMQQRAIQKELGTIVTSDEAARSQSAAAQQQRQILMLRSGPLGGQAKTDIDAIKILDAMKKGAAPSDMTQLLGDQDRNLTLERAIKQGTKVQQTSSSTLTDILGTLREMQLSAQPGTLRVAQQFTARAGSRAGLGEGINTELQEQLRNFQQTGIAPAHRGFVEQAKEDFKDIPNQLGTAGKALLDAMREVKSPVKEQFTPLDRGEYETPGEQVRGGIVAPKTAAGEAVEKASGPMLGHTGPIPVVLAGGSSIAVNFSGKCPHCNWDINTTEIARGISPSAAAPK